MTKLHLTERNCILRETASDHGRLAVSRVMEGCAKALFDLTTEQGLKGIVQKRKNSLYRNWKRSSGWLKAKNLVD